MPPAMPCWRASWMANGCASGGLDVLAQHVLGMRLRRRRSTPMLCMRK